MGNLLINGSPPDDIKLGVAQVDKVMFGDEQVWPMNVPQAVNPIGVTSLRRWVARPGHVNMIGSDVDSIVDQDGVFALQSFSATPAAMIEFAINNKGAVYGSNPRFGTGNGVINASPCTFIVVMKLEDATAAQKVAEDAQASNFIQWSSQVLRITGGTITPGTFPQDTAWHYYQVDLLGSGAYRVYIDGVLDSSLGTTFVNDITSGFTVMNNLVYQTCAEVIIFPGVLTGGEKTTVDSYMATEYLL